jgi:hypothetical protein
MTRFEMKKKVMNYVLSDQHKIEDYSDIEICCEEDIDNALLQVELKLTTSSDEELKELCDAIDSDTVDYLKHGVR